MDSSLNSSVKLIARRIPEHAFAIPLDTAGRVNADLSCRKCGYNLRGQLAEGICPECATPVSRAMQGDYLKFADPAWVNKLAIGMTLLLISRVSWFFYWAAIISYRPGRWAWVAIPHVLTGLIEMAAFWILTTPDPARAEQTVSALIPVVRWTQLIENAGRVIRASVNIPTAWLAVTVAITNAAIGVIAVFVGFRFLSQLVLRIPNPRMSLHFRILMWGFAVWSFTDLARTIFQYSLSTNRPRNLWYASTSCANFLLAVVFSSWAFVLIILARRALTNAARDARTTWAARA